MKTDAENTDNNAVSHKGRKDVIAALEEVWSREKVHVKISIPEEAAEKLEEFLKEKGLSRRDAVPMLICYGLPEESDEELEKLRSEKESKMNRIWGEYATTKFKAYVYFTENGPLTRRLPFSLAKNRSLKRQLTDVGLLSLVPRDEWDGWDDAVVDEYFRKYVFRSCL